jgi:predicted amidophosphoribosyltransferase
MQCGAAISISTFYVGAALQQHPHRLIHMAKYNSIYQRCVSEYKISSAIVIGVVKQDLCGVHVSEFSSDKQLLAGL